MLSSAESTHIVSSKVQFFLNTLYTCILGDDPTVTHCYIAGGTVSIAFRPSGSTGAPSVPTAPTGSGTRGARSQRQRESDVGAEHQPHQRRDDKEPGGHAAGMEEGASPTARSGMISLADLDLIKVIIIISMIIIIIIFDLIKVIFLV